MSYVDGGDSWLDEETPFFQGDDPRGGAGPVVEMEAMVGGLDPSRVAWVILRGGSFVGPDTRQAQVIDELRNRTLRVPGDGSNWVSFIHVADYAAAVAASIHSAVNGATFNITAEPVRNGDYLDRLAQLLNVPPPPRDPALPLPRSYRCSNAAARAALGWSPATDIWALAGEGA